MNMNKYHEFCFEYLNYNTPYRGQFMKEIRLLKEKGRDQKGEMSSTAATAIQRVWRGFVARRLTKKRKKEEQLLIGMVLPPYMESQEVQKAEEVSTSRLIIKTLFVGFCAYSIIKTYVRLKSTVESYKKNEKKNIKRLWSK